MTKNLEVLETWFQRVWNEGDASAIDEMFQEQGKARGLGGQDDSAEIDAEGGIAEQVRVGPAGFKGFHQSFFQMMVAMARPRVLTSSATGPSTLRI